MRGRQLLSQKMELYSLQSVQGLPHLSLVLSHYLIDLPGAAISLANLTSRRFQYLLAEPILHCHQSPNLYSPHLDPQ